MYAIITTLIENSDEVALGRLATCLGHDCPLKHECAVALKMEAAGVSADPPDCPVSIETLTFLWKLATRGTE